MTKLDANLGSISNENLNIIFSSTLQLIVVNLCAHLFLIFLCRLMLTIFNSSIEKQNEYFKEKTMNFKNSKST